MRINVETFEALLRERGMTRTELSRKSKVGTKTIGRIRLEEELRPSNVEKLAVALGVDLETLLKPPSDALIGKSKVAPGMQRLVVDMDGLTLNRLWMTSHHYNVSVRTLIAYAPMLFTIVAQMSLKQRRSRIEDWYASLEASLKAAPAQHEEEIRWVKDGALELYWAEIKSIEARDLASGASGPYSSDPSNRTTECVEQHPFFELLEELAGKAGRELDLYGCHIDDICYNLNDDDALTDLIPFCADSNDSAATEAITLGEVLVRDIPLELMSPNRTSERVAWIAEAYLADRLMEAPNE